MSLIWRVLVVVGVFPLLVGCAPKRVHITPEVAAISRVAVVNLADRAGKARPESEFFTNEFVSVGFSVLERGHLQELLDAAFTSTGYVDERTIATKGKGLGIDGVVLHQIVDNNPTDKENDNYDVNGWVRIVNVETGKIVLTYNTEVRASSAGNVTRAAKLYAERVVDDIKQALEQKGIRPGMVVKTQVEQKVEVQKKQVNP
ncbi:MAG: hypothetical protein JXQ73_29735 [Phycisphaerae bacterium]|nr:hypothetical protein [Phycisphaerae bacterium]